MEISGYENIEIFIKTQRFANKYENQLSVDFLKGRFQV
jgi:hypothetical protein